MLGFKVVDLKIGHEKYRNILSDFVSLINVRYDILNPCTDANTN